jgi:tetratricopeptide (TPR) repeat protein
MAYDALGSTYFHLDEFALSSENFQRAMDLSGRLSEREKLILRAHYYGEGRVSIPLGIENYRLWATAYPYDSRPVVSLVTLYTDIGQPVEGIPYGERALALQPGNALLYQALVRAYTHAGRFGEAKAMGARAVQVGKDNSHVHASLWQVAYAEHNAADLERERQWARSHTDGWYGWFYPDLEAGAAASEGRIRESEEIYAKAVAVARQEGLEDLANNLLTDQAQTEADLGELAKLRATLRRQTKPDADLIAVARLRVSLGDFAYAEKVLEQESRKPNQGFFVTTSDLPCLRAAIALGRNRPLEAIAALDGTQQYDLSDHLMALLRGQAYLQAGRAREALVEYRRIVDNPGQDPASPQEVLAQVGMARAYAMGGDVAAARREYAGFLEVWKGADQDAGLLKVVKAELAGLR